MCRSMRGLCKGVGGILGRVVEVGGVWGEFEWVMSERGNGAVVGKEVRVWMLW